MLRFEPNLTNGDCSLVYDYARVEFNSGDYIDIESNRFNQTDSELHIVNTSPGSSASYDRILFMSGTSGQIISSKIIIPCKYTNIVSVQFRQKNSNKCIIFDSSEFRSWIQVAPSKTYRSIEISQTSSSSESYELRYHTTSSESEFSASSLVTHKKLSEVATNVPYSHMNQLRYSFRNQSKNYCYADSISSLINNIPSLGNIKFVYGSYYIRPDFVKAFLGFEQMINIPFSQSYHMYPFINGTYDSTFTGVNINHSDSETEVARFYNNSTSDYNVGGTLIYKLDSSTEALTLSPDGKLYYDKSKLGTLSSNKFTIIGLNESDGVQYASTYSLIDDDPLGISNYVKNKIYCRTIGYYSYIDPHSINDNYHYDYLDVEVKLNGATNLSIDKSGRKFYLNIQPRDTDYVVIKFKSEDEVVYTKTIPLVYVYLYNSIIGDSTISPKDEKYHVIFKKVDGIVKAVVEGQECKPLTTPDLAFDEYDSDSGTILYPEYHCYGSIYELDDTIYDGLKAPLWSTNLPRIYHTVKLSDKSVLIYAIDPKKYDAYVSGSDYTYDSSDLTAEDIESFNNMTRPDLEDYTEKIPYNQNIILYAHFDDIKLSYNIISK